MEDEYHKLIATQVYSLSVLQIQRTLRISTDWFLRLCASREYLLLASSYLSISISGRLGWSISRWREKQFPLYRGNSKLYANKQNSLSPHYKRDNSGTFWSRASWWKRPAKYSTNWLGFGDTLPVYTRGIFSLKSVYTTVWRSYCSIHPSIVRVEHLYLHGRKATAQCSTKW